MSGTAPWSVKGIDPKAREAAREAARRDGLTVGAWLNQAILTSGGGAAGGGEAPAHTTGPTLARSIEQALATLQARIDASDRRTALAVNGLDRALLGLAARVEDSHGGQRNEAARVDAIIADLRSAQEALTEEVRRLEAEAPAAAADQAERLDQLDASVAALDARLSVVMADPSLHEQVAQLRAGVESRLSNMAEDFRAMVETARSDMFDRIIALKPEEIEAGLTEANRRLAAAERRHGQTIEAVSIEIKRLTETMDRRLRTLETRNDDSGEAALLREDIAQISADIDRRLEEIGRRDAEALQRMGQQVEEVAERLDQRIEASERRGAAALEQIGEQIVHVASRFTERQDALASSISERLSDSDGRSNARFADALEDVKRRLAEIEGRAAAPRPAAPVSPPSNVGGFVGRPMEPDPRDRSALGLSMRTQLRFETEPLGNSDPFASPPPSASAPLEDLIPTSPAPGIAANPAPGKIVQPRSSAGEAPDDVFESLLTAVHELGETTGAAKPAQPAEELYLEDIEAEFERPRSYESAFFDEVIDSGQETGADEALSDWSAGDPSDSESEFDVPLGDVHADQPELAGFDDDDDLWADAPEESETLAIEKQDYLSHARRAAQAQHTPAPETPAPRAKSERDGLRGVSPALLWAGAVAAAIGGGAYLVTHGKAEPEAGKRSGMAGELEQFAAAVRANVSGAVDHALGDALNVRGALPPGSIGEGVARVAAARAAAQQEILAKAVRAGPMAIDLPSVDALMSPSRPRAELGPESQGEAIGLYQRALSRLARGDTTGSAAMLHRAAADGLAVAQYRLGKMYARGEDGRADLTAARRWTARAALAGSVKAMHDLGVYNARGEGGQIDQPAAFRWFREASGYGFLDSQYNLAVLYEQGRGTAADPEEALYWFSIAALHGDEDAKSRTQVLAAQLGPVRAGRIEARAAEFRPRPLDGLANGAFETHALQAAIQSETSPS